MVIKVREVIAYRNYFEDFLKEQPIKIQDKIFKVIEIIESYERIPTQYLRIFQGHLDFLKQELNWALIFGAFFFFFDEGKLVILLNGFQKKTQKTPKKEIDKAIRLMSKYFAKKQKEGKK